MCRQIGRMAAKYGLSRQSWSPGAGKRGPVGVAFHVAPPSVER
jgi:hypothetical protein